MGMIAVVTVPMAVPRAIGMDMLMAVLMVFTMMVVVTVDLYFAAAAAACGAHMNLSPQATSSSLTRISVPPVTCIW